MRSLATEEVTKSLSTRILNHVSEHNTRELVTIENTFYEVSNRDIKKRHTNNYTELQCLNSTYTHGGQ